MAFIEREGLDCDTTTALGGINKRTGKPNPKSVEGYFIGSRQVDSAMSKTGKAYIHVLKTADGNTGVWGKTDLDRKLDGAVVGAMTRLTFTGTRPATKPGLKPMFKFKVEQDLKDVIEVSNFETQVANDDAPEATEGYAEGYDGDEASVDSDEYATDEVVAARPTAPRTAAKTPDLAQQEKVKKLLSGTRTRSA